MNMLSGLCGIDVPVRVEIRVLAKAPGRKGAEKMMNHYSACPAALRDAL
jgi:hypothetical protein